MYKKIQKIAKQNDVILIAVSKTKPKEAIQFFYDKGQRDFGENRVQELVDKAESLPDDIRWHQIGHLQKNKVKYLAPFVYMIHTVDSIALLKLISEFAYKYDRVIKVLLQVKIAAEDSKFGLSKPVLLELIDAYKSSEMPHVEICGMMGMATFTDDASQVRSEFRSLKETFDEVKEKYFASQISFDTISMGMSGDYPIAIEEGSTMIRVGSLIFGSRTYV